MLSLILISFSVSSIEIGEFVAKNSLQFVFSIVRRLIKENKIKAYRFGNQIRIVADSLDAYIDRQKIRPKTMS